MSEARRTALRGTILKGLPGKMTKAHDLASFRAALAEYDGVSVDALRANLAYFVARVMPVAQAAGVLMAIHPDDPPTSLLGLPRCVSTEADVDALLAASDAPAHGLCFCAGSYASRPDNDVTAMARKFARRVHFVHLRNVTRANDEDVVPKQNNAKNMNYYALASFVESDHLVGNVDVYAVVKALLEEQKRRVDEADRGGAYARLPMRPDHGHQMLDDLDKSDANPGYTAIGRLRGLAELTGVQHAILRAESASQMTTGSNKKPRTKE